MSLQMLGPTARYVEMTVLFCDYVFYDFDAGRVILNFTVLVFSVVNCAVVAFSCPNLDSNLNPLYR